MLILINFRNHALNPTNPHHSNPYPHHSNWCCQHRHCFSFLYKQKWHSNTFSLLSEEGVPQTETSQPWYQCNVGFLPSIHQRQWKIWREVQTGYSPLQWKGCQGYGSAKSWWYVFKTSNVACVLAVDKQNRQVLHNDELNPAFGDLHLSLAALDKIGANPLLCDGACHHFLVLLLMYALIVLADARAQVW